MLHTHGRHGQYHPHLHVLATSGGYDAQDARWEHLQYMPYALLRRQWQWHLLTTLRQTIKTDAVHRLVDTCFRQYPDGLVTNVPQGRRPRPGAQCGTLRGQICGKSTDRCPAH